MCLALAGVGLGGLFSALGSVASFIGQSQAANAQEQYQRDLFEAREKERKENAESAINSFVQQTHDKNRQIAQQQEAAAEEKRDLDDQAKEVAGTALASTGSQGVGLDLLLGNLKGQQGRYNNTIETQLAWDVEQLNADKLALEAQAIDRINSVRPYIPQPVNKPNPLALVAGVGASLAKGIS